MVDSICKWVKEAWWNLCFDAHRIRCALVMVQHGYDLDLRKMQERIRARNPGFAHNGVYYD